LPAGPLPSRCKAFLRKPQLRSLLAVTTVTSLFGTLSYWPVEGWSVLDSFYLCVITLTTAGHRDPTPATIVGKVFTILYLIAGIAWRARPKSLLTKSLLT